jgi:lambda family phage portal protein
MNWLDRAIMTVAPVSGARRIAARAAVTRLTAHYEATQPGNRGTSWRATRADADTAAASRQRLAGIALDMVRNSPLATRAQQVISSNVVGDGIIPKVIAKRKGERESAMRLIEAHFDTTDIDADGRNNLYGLQRLVVNALVASGEVLIRRRRRERRDGFSLPFQIQVIEIDFLDTFAFGKGAEGNVVRDGIEYDAIGRRVAYHLLSDHPGARGWRNLGRASRRVLASEILHIYRQDRPGQMRGVSWFAPVALALQDMADHQDAQLMRQKIAACFAAFRVTPDGEPETTRNDPGGLSTLVPGRIQTLAPGEDIRFAEPPGVQGYDEFTRSVSRTVAAGLGVTYEALTGDLTGVNFSSARIGRLEMDRNVSAWQWLLLIPQMMQPLAKWFDEAWAIADPVRARQVKLQWVPPRRMLIDPNREITALRDKVRAGFSSRSEGIREMGYDPERVLEEQIADAAAADQAGMIFDTDPRHVSISGVAQSVTGQGGDDGNTTGTNPNAGGDDA